MLGMWARGSVGQRPHSPVPVTHVGVAEEAILGGDGTADCGSIKLLHRCSQDEGAGLPESLGTQQMGGKQQMGGGETARRMLGMCGTRGITAGHVGS